MKAQILIPVHCKPKIMMMTIGSWLETYDGSYKANIIIGLHENYSHYCDASAEFKEMLSVDGVVSFCYTKEIEWHTWDLLRYSRMHAKSLLTMMQKCTDDCTHVAFFDHDLVFKQDLVKFAMERDADWTCSLFDDLHTPRFMETGHGPFYFAPKPSIWNMVIKRRLFDLVMEETELVSPTRFGSTIYDIFAQVYEMAKDSWGMKLDVLTTAEMEEVVKHLWSLSFNFGVADAVSRSGHDKGMKEHDDKVRAAEEEYDKRFPDGIQHLLEKLA